jgi:hypothetical protein
LSRETTKGTEFVAVLSDQPQGGLAMRRRSAPSEYRYARKRERPIWGSPYGDYWGSGNGSYWGSPYGGPSYRW